MPLKVHHVALETITALRPLMPMIRRHDRSLAVQLTRAVSSAVLNIGVLPNNPELGKIGHRLSPHRRSATPLSRGQAHPPNARVDVLPPAHLLRRSAQPIASHQRPASARAALAGHGHPGCPPTGAARFARLRRVGSGLGYADSQSSTARPATRENSLTLWLTSTRS